MPIFTFQDSEARKSYEEPGEYLVTVEGFEFTFASSGNEMLTLKLRTSGGALVFAHLVFSDNSYWKIDHALKCFMPSKGAHPPAKGTPFDLNTDYANQYLLGATGWVTLSKGTTPGGKIRNDVQSYNLPKKGAQPVKPTTKLEPATTPTSTSTSANPAAAPAPAVPADADDIPF